MPWLHLFAGIFLWWLVLYLCGFWNWVDHYRPLGPIDYAQVAFDDAMRQFWQDARIEWVCGRPFVSWLKAAADWDDSHPERWV